MRVFVLRHLLNENDVNMLETIETWHFSTSNYIRSVVGEVHLLNLINEILLFLSISLIFDISIHGRKNKTCVTKTLFTNFTRRNCFLRIWLIVAGRVSRVESRGRGSNVAVAGSMSRSRVQSRGRGSNVAAEENDLGFKVTEWKWLIWTQYKGKKIFFMHYTLR